MGERGRKYVVVTRLSFLAEDHVLHSRHDSAIVPLDDRCGGVPVRALFSLPFQHSPDAPCISFQVNTFSGSSNAKKAEKGSRARTRTK